MNSLNNEIPSGSPHLPGCASIRSNMNQDRWKRLEEIYHSARTRNIAERAAYVAEACGNDEDLKAQVESLLVHGEALSKLESKVVQGTAPTPLAAGAMVGPYRIKERL